MGGGTVMSKRWPLPFGASQTPGEDTWVSTEENMVLICGNSLLGCMDWGGERGPKIWKEVRICKGRAGFEHAKREPRERWAQESHHRVPAARAAYGSRGTHWVLREEEFESLEEWDHGFIPDRRNVKIKGIRKVRTVSNLSLVVG